MAKLLGIDVGTSGAKAVLVDENGHVLRQASAEYPLSVPRPLWSEQSPTDWWQGVQACIEAIGERRPDAIGLTGQMHGAVFLDAADEVIRPAILWNDQRTAAECAEIDAAVGPERVRTITKNPPLTGFQAPKLLWLRNHELSNYQRLRSLLLPKDYIRFLMTGERVTEVSDASGTGLLDVAARDWSAEMLAALEIDPQLLPKVVESHEVTGTTRGLAGLEDGIPIVGGGGDQAAGAVGTGAVEKGILSVSLGTSGVVFTALDAPNADPSGAAHTFCHANGAWHAMGVMLSCGGAMRWARDTHFPSEGYEGMRALASGVAPGANGATFLPYLTGERSPHNDPAATGAFAGLTLAVDRAAMARAVYEGVSFGIFDCFSLLAHLGATAEEIRVTGGGARSPLWLSILADLFERPCVTLEVDEGPAFGAAILAGVGIGIWPDVAAACRNVIRRAGTVEPQGSDYGDAYQRYRGLYPALRWHRGAAVP